MTLLFQVGSALAELAPTGRILVALSGGADSVAALRLTLALGRDATAAHFDHRLREASAADAAFVRDLCAGLGVPLVEGGADVGRVADERRWNLEDAARRLRYDFLHRAARQAGCEAVLVAHTLDDQAETFLLQALRGSAFPAGMPVRRGIVVRPLLGVARARLRAYLTELAQPWREDETNRDPTRTRAWLRHEVMPVITARYPRAAERLSGTATVLRDAGRAIEQVSEQLLGSGSLSLGALAAAPPALQRSALARLVVEAGVTPTLELIESAREAVARAAAEERPGPWRLSLDDDRFLRAAYGRVEVAQRRPPTLSVPVRIASLADLEAAARALPGGRAALSRHELPPADEVERLLAAHPAGLVLRHRSPGDRVRLPGGGKSLADLLVDRKVPAEERGALRLLVAERDEGEGEVVWVEGLDLGEPSDDDVFMRQALDLARAAAAAGELPVGAVVVRDGRVLAAAGNRTEATGDPSAHAELLALRAAARETGDWRVDDATLYVTLEPCPMCFGAVLQTRVKRVVYGAANVREGALGSVMDLRYGRWKRGVEVDGGVMAAESARLLKEFFAGRR